MDVIEKVSSEMVKAAKDKDKAKLSALRMIKSALHNREIDLKDRFGEKEILQVLSSMIKQRKDSVEQFRNGGRPELAEKEEKEIEVIQGFMPEQMSEEEIKAEIENAIEEAGATSIRDMGKVMKLLMPRLTGKADGKAVGETVKARLS
ncbi:MAG: GatB/YqeY domain-containing protein [Deltaproteobacteria bacterium]|nr:GatB/YqeY domain-containing protein [Deltaproteobacteria bacterium]